MRKRTTKLRHVVVAGTFCLLSCLTGCQPPPVEEEQVRADFPLDRKEISIGNASHVLELSSLTIVNRSAEDDAEIVYCEYTVSDGVYEASGEYALSYEYNKGNWYCFDAWQTVEPTVTAAAETPPEELLARFEEWEEHFSSSETVTRTSEIEKISDTQFQASYTVTKNYDYWQSSTEYIVQGELNPLFTGTDLLLWDIKEGEESPVEKWDIAGEYLYEDTRSYGNGKRIYLKIDSFDAETLTAHVARGEYQHTRNEEVEIVSDVTVQFEYPEVQFGVPRYIRASFDPFSVEIHTNSFKAGKGEFDLTLLEKIS